MKTSTAHVKAHSFATVKHQHLLKSTAKGTLQTFYCQNNLQKETALNRGSYSFCTTFQEVGKSE